MHFSIQRGPIAHGLLLSQVARGTKDDDCGVLFEFKCAAIVSVLALRTTPLPHPRMYCVQRIVKKCDANAIGLSQRTKFEANPLGKCISAAGEQQVMTQADHKDLPSINIAVWLNDSVRHVSSDPLGVANFLGLWIFFIYFSQPVFGGIAVGK